MNKNRSHTRLQNLGNVFLLNHRVAVDNHLITLDRNHFAGVFVNEVLVPRAQHAGSKLAAHCLLEVGLVHLEFLGQAEDLDDIIVSFQSDGTQQRGHR